MLIHFFIVVTPSPSLFDRPSTTNGMASLVAMTMHHAKQNHFFFVSLFVVNWLFLGGLQGRLFLLQVQVVLTWIHLSFCTDNVIKTLDLYLDIYNGKPV